MKENEIPEEVRQEVRIRICNIRQCLDEDRFDQASSEGDGLITYILSAVRDGKQELPGEAGRAVWVKQGDEDHIYDWVADVIENGVRTFIAFRPGEEKETYQIRNSGGDILAEFSTLLEARIASVDMKEGTEIVERKFVDGEWEETIVYQRIIALRPKEEK